MNRKFKLPISIFLCFLILFQSIVAYPKGKNSDKKIVVCIGDSITRANVSYSYIKLLEKSLGSKFKFYNKGVNGDLAWNVVQRINEIIALNPDYITIMIGSNDVLSTFSEKKTKTYIKYKKLPQAANKDWYIENLKLIITILKAKTKAKIALISIPLITEDKEHIMFKRSIECSENIKNTASEFGLTYLALNEKQQKFYEGNETKTRVVFSDKNSFSVNIVLKHYLLCRKWDKLSKKYGLQLTTDLVHLNSKGAKMISDLIESFLKEN